MKHHSHPNIFGALLLSERDGEQYRPENAIFSGDWLGGIHVNFLPFCFGGDRKVPAIERLPRWTLAAGTGDSCRPGGDDRVKQQAGGEGGSSGPNTACRSCVGMPFSASQCPSCLESAFAAGESRCSPALACWAQMDSRPTDGDKVPPHGAHGSRAVPPISSGGRAVSDSRFSAHTGLTPRRSFAGSRAVRSAVVCFPLRFVRRCGAAFARRRSGQFPTHALLPSCVSFIFTLSFKNHASHSKAASSRKIQTSSRSADCRHILSLLSVPSPDLSSSYSGVVSLAHLLSTSISLYSIYENRISIETRAPQY